MKDTVANLLVKYLEARGVEHIFGLCGHTNIAVLAALSKSKKIKFIAAPRRSPHMRPTAMRALRQGVGAVMHLSPGSPTPPRRGPTALDSIPMVVIAGDVPLLLWQAPAPGSESARTRRNTDLPSVCQAGVAGRFGDHQWHSRSPSGRPGPVLVDVPMDIFSKEVEVALFDVCGSCQGVLEALARRRPRRRSSATCSKQRRRYTSAAASCSPAEMREPAGTRRCPSRTR